MNEALTQIEMNCVRERGERERERERERGEGV